MIAFRLGKLNSLGMKANVRTGREGERVCVC